MNAYLICQHKDGAPDAKSAEWFFGTASWVALDAAARAGFDESTGFSVVRTLPAEQVVIEGDGYPHNADMWPFNGRTH